MKKTEVIKPWELDTCPVTGFPIRRKPEWTDVTFDTDYYRITYSVIGRNIVLAKTWGRSTLDTTMKYFSLLEKIVDNILPGGEEYLLLEDYSDHKNASFRAKTYYINYAKSDNNKRGKALIFYNVSSLFQIMIKLGKRISQTEKPVRIVPDYRSAILLAQQYLSEDKQEKNGKEIVMKDDNKKPAENKNSSLNTVEKKGKGKTGRTDLTEDEEERTLTVSQIKKDIDNVLKFMGVINWDTDGINAAMEKSSESELLKPIIESVSLIKQDFDAIFKEKNKAEKAVAEQIKYSKLRADIWRLAADKSLTEYELIQKLLDKVGPAMGVSRACYNKFTGDAQRKAGLENVSEWCNDGVKPTLGTKIPAFIVKHFVKDKSFILNKETVLEMIPPGPIRTAAAPVISRIIKTQNLNSALAFPHYIKGDMKGLISFDICNDNKEKTSWADYDMDIISEMAGIVSNKINQIRAEKELVDSEEQLRILFEFAPDGYYLNDLKGNFIDGNKMAEELTGYKKDELIGKTFLKLKLLPANQIPKAAKLLAKNALGQPTGPDEVILNQKNGGQVTVEISTFPVKIKGKLLILGIARDITERKSAFEKEKQYTQDLEYLSETALGFIELPAKKNIYSLIGDCLKKLVGNAYIIVNSFNKETHSVQVQAVIFGKYLEGVIKIIGRDPQGMSFIINDEAWQGLTSGKLVKVPGGLYELTFGDIPRIACDTVEKLMGVGDIYGMGFTKKGELYGSATFIMRKGVELRNREVIETFMAQAGVALQRNLADEALLKVVEEEKQRTRSLEYLSRTALEFVAFPPEKDIYEHIGLRLKEIVGKSLIVVDSFEESTGLLLCRSIVGVGKLMKAGSKLLGRNPVGMSFKIVEEFEPQLRSGKLIRMEMGMAELTGGQIPEKVCKAIEKLVGIEDIYLLGIAREDKLFAHAVILTRKGTKLKDVTTIQTFASQASVALQRKHADEALLKVLEKEKQYIRNLEYLSKTALEFVTFPPEKDIYEYIGLCLKEIVGNAVILVSSFEESTGLLLFRSIVGLGSLSDAAFKLVGRSPKGMSFAILEENDQPLKRGELIRMEKELYELAGGQIPRKACKAIEKLVGIEGIYSLGFARGGELFAHASILARKGAELEDMTTIKTFASQTSIFLHRRQAEKEKEKVQAQLLQAQKLEAIGTLAGGVAHDFNNLLTIISGNVDLAMMKIGKSGALYEGMEEISSAVKRAASLTRQLLLFGRKEPMGLLAIDINIVINNLLKMLNRIIGEDIAISMELEPELWLVDADEVNVEQVITNLAVNARDAMPEGGKLVVKTKNVTVDKEQCETAHEAYPGKFVCLSVKDTGCGMDKETVKRIFEPFFTTKELGKGTGLGLSVAYGIIKEHKGWVNVYSEPEKGSVFKVYLPVSVEGRIYETKEKPSLESLRGNGERILVVEDENVVRETARRILEKNGYIVFEALSAEEALVIYKKEKGNFHMIFSDIILPGKNGFELVSELISQKPELKVLMSSGYTGDKLQLSIVKEKGLKFIQKPYGLIDLLEAVRNSLK